MSAASIAQFLEHSRSSYVADLVASGVDTSEAERLAADQQAEAFPDGQPTDGHLVMEAIADTEVCGSVWIGPHAIGDTKHWWVWDIEIAEAFRGRGIGRWVMRMAEECARQRGANDIGLTVFADNVAARRLYDDLGFREVSMRLTKAL
jgi:ribosomal protein S18 acetylase RimI-like enzyme